LVDNQTKRLYNSICKLGNMIMKGVIMPQFEVTYKVLENNIQEGGAWRSSGPSHYTTVVTADYQGAAEQMVRNMNGGREHCYIVRAMMI